MTVAGNVAQGNKHKDFLIFGGIAVLLLLLSVGFVFVIYSTIGFVEQVYVIIVTWLILNMMIIPGFSKVQKILKEVFGRNIKSKCLGYLVYIVVPPLLFNGLLYQFKYITGLLEFTLYILVPTSVIVIITIYRKNLREAWKKLLDRHCICIILFLHV